MKPTPKEKCFEQVTIQDLQDWDREGGWQMMAEQVNFYIKAAYEAGVKKGEANGKQ